MSLAFMAQLKEFQVKLVELELKVQALEQKVSQSGNKSVESPMVIPVLLKRGPGRPPNVKTAAR